MRSGFIEVLSQKTLYVRNSGTFDNILRWKPSPTIHKRRHWIFGQECEDLKVPGQMRHCKRCSYGTSSVLLLFLCSWLFHARTSEGPLCKFAEIEIVVLFCLDLTPLARLVAWEIVGQVGVHRENARWHLQGDSKVWEIWLFSPRISPSIRKPCLVPLNPLPKRPAEVSFYYCSCWSI